VVLPPAFDPLRQVCAVVTATTDQIEAEFSECLADFAERQP
jgi:hypothetical protein